MGGLDDLSRSGTLMFYCMQPLGILLEYGVQAAYLSLFEAEAVNGSPPWARFLRYIWVVGFLLVWTTPMWFVPMGQARGICELLLILYPRYEVRDYEIWTAILSRRGILYLLLYKIVFT